MATILYLRSNTVALWDSQGNAPFFSVKDASRAVTCGADTFSRCTPTGGMETAVGTGTGFSFTFSTVTGPTAGKIPTVAQNIGWISAPVAANVTISGTVTFNICGSENNMSANATFRARLFCIDESGVLTLIADGTAGTELGTTISRQTFTATPTSTLVKKGWRFLLVPMIDDATAVNMAVGFTVIFNFDGANASTADTNVTFTETVTFLTTDPTGTTYWLRDSASNITGMHNLSTTQGAASANAYYTTKTGPIAFASYDWLDYLIDTDFYQITPPLNAFTLGGVVKFIFQTNTLTIESLSTPFDCLTVELAVVDADGVSNLTIWARSYTSCDSPGAGNRIVYLTGPDLAVGQGKRIRLRMYSDDSYPDTQVAGTTRYLYYGGTGAYASSLVFTQTITEAPTASTAAPGAGQLVVTGLAPNATSINKITTALGNLTISGFAPSIIQGVKVNAGVGVLTVNGFSPSIVSTNNQSVIAGLGQLSANGFAPSVISTNNQRALAATGSLLINGFSPTTSVSNNQTALIGLANLTINGFSPTVVQGTRTNTATGQLILTGFSPTLAISNNQSVVVGLANLTVNGFSPTLNISNNQSVIVGLGSLVIVGSAPTIRQNIFAYANSGLLIINGFAPTISVGNAKQAFAGLGSLTIDGFAPSLVLSNNQSANTASGLVIINGLPPSIIGGIRSYAGLGQLLVNGFAPSIAAPSSISVNVGLGQLTLTGYAPVASLGSMENPSLTYSGQFFPIPSDW